jgi:hypothetical protein
MVEVVRTGLDQEDRLDADLTCAITRIPPEWIRQLADGGPDRRTPRRRRRRATARAGQDRPDEVTGRIDPYPVWFISLREQAPSTCWDCLST